VTAPSGSDPILGAFQRVLAAQHAAIYGYSVIGVHLSADPADRARVLQAAHRSTRDALMIDLAGRGAIPVEAEPFYSPAGSPGERITDEAGAQRWALRLEEDCAAGYRFLLAVSATASAPQAAIRRTALIGLIVAAQYAMEWRALLTPSSPTVPFPGT